MLLNCDDYRSVIHKYIKQNCIYNDCNGVLLSPIGMPQSWMIDIRYLFLNTNLLNKTANLFVKRIDILSHCQILGLETAGIPLLIALSMQLFHNKREINACIVRKGRKTYGLGRTIEGRLTDDPIILVDDILNSGDSLEKARVALAQEGKSVSEVFVVIDFRSRKGMAWREKHGIKVTSLFTLADFGLSLETQKPVPKRDWALRWQFSANGASPFHAVPKSTPLLVGNRLYFGSDSATFWCLDAASGARLWSFKVESKHRKGIWSSPAHHDGRIYFGAYSGDLFCLDAATGQEIWRNPACDWIGSSPLLLPRHELLVVGLEYERPRAKGGMAAFALATGEKLWERPMARYQHGSAAYWEEGDLIVCGNSDHSLLAQRPTSGETVWEYPTERSIKYPPAIDPKRKLAVAASFDGFIYIMELETGVLVAKFKTDSICYTTPLISHGRVFCGSGDKHLYVIDLDRMELVDKLDCGSRIYSSPRLIGGTVGFGSNGGVYREIDPDTLELETFLQLPDAITNAISASADGRTIYVPTYMNEIYAFDRVSDKAAGAQPAGDVS